MTDHIDQTEIDEIEESEARDAKRARRMFLTGAGIAGAAAIVGKSGVASAADGADVVVGASLEGDTPTQLTNTNTATTTPGTPGGEAFVGIVEDAGNGSHAIRGVTNGLGHSIAGDTPDGPNTVAATWGRHAGQGAGVGGVNVAATSPLAGPARGVEGVITSTGNGSHAVFGATQGAGHSVAGDTPADAEDGSGGPNTTAATWGRHGGLGAGIGGINTGNGYGGEFVGGKSHVRLIQTEDADAGAPDGDDHLLGELYADGAGDLFYNTADGSNWVSLTKPVGSTHLMMNPQRAFDSRPGEATNTDQGRLSAGETVEVDLTEFTDFEAGFQGALLNVTLVEPDTSSSGYVTVFNGDTADGDRPPTSSVNWDIQTDEIANSVTVRVSTTGTVKVYAVRSTDLVVDVIGYIV